MLQLILLLAVYLLYFILYYYLLGQMWGKLKSQIAVAVVHPLLILGTVCSQVS